MIILKYEPKRIPTLCTMLLVYKADTDDNVWGEVIFECL